MMSVLGRCEERDVEGRGAELERLEDEEMRLRQELRLAIEAKRWLEVSGAEPDAILKVERDIAMTRRRLEEIEKLRQEVMHSATSL